MTLYELTNDFQTLYDLAGSGEIDNQTFQDTLEAMRFDENFTNKADGYAKVIKQLEHDEAAVASECSRLAERKARIAANRAAMKDNLRDAMKTVGMEKIKTELFNLRVQKNPPSLAVAEGAEIPQEYLIPVEPKLDKRKMLEAVKNGAEIEGVSLQQSESLRIS